MANEITTAAELVGYLFTNGAGEKAKELRVYGIYGGYLGGWNRDELLAKVEELVTAAESRGFATALEQAARAICGLCANNSYTPAALESDGQPKRLFYFHRYADVADGGNVRKSCAADKILKRSPSPDYATKIVERERERIKSLIQEMREEGVGDLAGLALRRLLAAIDKEGE